MTDKLAKRIREAEEEHAGEVLDAHLAESQDRLKMRAMYILGGVNIAGKVAASLGSEAIKALVTFQEQKLHEALGHETFVDFLTESEYAPMTKAQFYERKAILEKEGETLFDLLTEMGMSIRRRKLLGKGNIEVVNNTIVVHNGDDKTVIDLDDRSTILTTLSALADANAEKSIKLERQKEKLDKHDSKVRELYDEIDQVKASKAAEIGQDGHAMAAANLMFAYAALRDEVAKLTPVERLARKDNVWELIAGQETLLHEAYGKHADAKPAAAADDATFEELLDAHVDNVIAGKFANDNEAELAGKL